MTSQCSNVIAPVDSYHWYKSGVKWVEISEADVDILLVSLAEQNFVK